MTYKLQLTKSIANKMELRAATPEESEAKDFDLSIARIYPEHSDREFAIGFRVSISFEGKFLYVEYLSMFEVDQPITEEFKASHYAQKNAPAIAFPFVRSYIAHVTLIAGYQPVVLPSVDFTKLVDQPQEAAETAQ